MKSSVLITTNISKYRAILILFIVCISIPDAGFAQIAKRVKNVKSGATGRNTANQPINKFLNTIYNTIYNPAFRSKCYMPTYTVFKIDIDQSGKVSGMGFSDSADTLFTHEFAKRIKNYDEVALLERYAKDNQINNASIIIPVNYMPYHNPRQEVNYERMTALMKFSKVEFSGRAIILDAINVITTKDGNM